MDLNTPIFLGNTWQSVIIFVAVILAATVIGKIIEIIFKRIFHKLMKKTKNKFDDIIVEEVGHIIFHLMLVAGIYGASLTLTLTDTIRIYYGKFIKILIIFIVTRFLLSFWNSVLTKVIHPKVKATENDLDDLLLPALSKTLKGLIVVMAALVVMSDLGFNVLSFVAGLGIGGLALAMASKDFVANLFGAFSIYSDRMFKIGDRIKVKGVEGKVVDIGLRSIRLKQKDGTTIIVPNSLMTTNPVENKDFSFLKK